MSSRRNALSWSRTSNHDHLPFFGETEAPCAPAFGRQRSCPPFPVVGSGWKPFLPLIPSRAGMQEGCVDGASANPHAVPRGHAPGRPLEDPDELFRLEGAGEGFDKGLVALLLLHLDGALQQAAGFQTVEHLFGDANRLELLASCALDVAGLGQDLEDRRTGGWRDFWPAGRCPRGAPASSPFRRCPSGAGRRRSGSRGL